MSDWWGQHTGVASVLAGLDMTMPGDQSYNDAFANADTFWGSNLTASVLNGTIPQWRLDDMAVRIMSSFYKGKYRDNQNSGMILIFSFSWQG
jgi:beta-glucosidase